MALPIEPLIMRMVRQHKENLIQFCFDNSKQCRALRHL